MNSKDKIIATDSGGFQVFSLGFGKSHGVGKIAGIFPEEKTNINNTQDIKNDHYDKYNPLKITDDGVTFVYDNKEIILTPEISMNIQHRIGADIIFAFDECTSPLNSKKYTEEALDRTHYWINRCISYHNNSKTTKNNLLPRRDLQNNHNNISIQSSSHLKNNILPFSTTQKQQALFGIIQGGAYSDLRKKSTRYFAQLDVPGYGIGGSLGKTKEEMYQILNWVIPYLPENKPRHLLGIGHIKDIF